MLRSRGSSDKLGDKAVIKPQSLFQKTLLVFVIETLFGVLHSSLPCTRTPAMQSQEKPLPDAKLKASVKTETTCD